MRKNIVLSHYPIVRRSAAVAQLTVNQLVAGSNPAAGAMKIVRPISGLAFFIPDARFVLCCNHKRRDTIQGMKTMHKNQNGFTVVEILIVVALLGIVGLIGWRFVDSQQENTNPPNQLNNRSVLPESLAGIKSIDEIITQAAPEIAARQVLAAELEQEDEGLVYSIKLSDGTVLVFDAKTGNKVQLKAPDGVDTDDDKPLPAGFKPAVTLETAVQTAKTQRAGKVVEKVELEVEDGIVVYSVRFSDDGRVDIDANTGSVLRIREPGKPDVKLQDVDNDIDDDGQQNGQDIDDDNDDIKDIDDNDNENDGVTNDADADDDNDGTSDTSDNDSSNSGSGSSDSGSDGNSGSNSGSDRN